MTRFEALTSKDWEEIGFAPIIVLRTDDKTGSAACLFQVDIWCLGARNVEYREKPTKETLQGFIGANISKGQERRIHPAHAKKLVEGAVAYAATLGFAPCRGFDKAFEIFEGLELEKEGPSFVFGKDGKPCYMSWPGDSKEMMRSVLASLEDAVGPDGFTLMAPELDDDLLGKDESFFADDDEEDEDEIPDEDLEDDPDIDEVRESILEFVEAGPEDWPTFEWLLGAITAYQVCPGPVAPDYLLHALPSWEKNGFESEEAMKRFLENFTRYWKSIGDLLALEAEAGPSAESGIDITNEDFTTEREVRDALRDWARGFCDTLASAPDAWGEAPSKPELAPHFAVIEKWAKAATGSKRPLDLKRERSELDRALLALYVALRKE